MSIGQWSEKHNRMNRCKLVCKLKHRKKFNKEIDNNVFCNVHKEACKVKSWSTLEGPNTRTNKSDVDSRLTEGSSQPLYETFL